MIGTRSSLASLVLAERRVERAVGRASGLRRRRLCHSGEMTYDPARAQHRSSPGAARRVAGTAAGPARPARTRMPGGPGPTVTGRSNGANRPGWGGSSPPTAGARTRCRFWWSHRGGGVPDGHRAGRRSRRRRRPSRGRRPRSVRWAPRSSTHRRAGSPLSTPTCRPGRCRTGDRSPRRATRPGTWCRGPRRRSGRAPPRCSRTPSRSRTVWTPRCSAATTRSPRWSTRRWTTRRAGRITRNSRSSGSTQGRSPTSGFRWCRR